MSDMTTPPDPNPAPVTEPLQLTDQAPVAAAAPEPVAKTSHTRTILEVVGVVVAFFLILGAGTAGFVVGHATSNGGKHGRVAVFQQGDGGMMGGQGKGDGRGNGQRGFGGPGMMGGQQGDGGMMGGQRGIDPDGDNWTGGGQQGFGGPGMMGGQPGPQGPQGLGGPGMMVIPRGVDPNGDNWTGGGQQGQGTSPTAPQSPVTPQTPASPQASPSGA